MERSRSVRRSRWAAIGAAIAVSLGGGGVFIAGAVGPSAPSSIITIDPVRILDTRDPVNVGLAGPFVSAVSQKLQVTGSVATTAGLATPVPTGATGVLLNVTAVGPTAEGFISVRPGDATVLPPKTSNLNFSVNETAPNSVQVALPTTGANAGQLDITYDALGVAGPTTDILIDVMGYLVPAAPAGPQVTFDSAVVASNLPVAVLPDAAPFTAGTLVRDLTLPAGSYQITATNSVRGGTGGTAGEFNTRVRCNLVNASTATGLDTFYADFFRPDEPAPGFRQALQVGALVTFAAPTTVELRCYTAAPPAGAVGASTTDGLIASSKLEATQVSTIIAGN